MKHTNGPHNAPSNQGRHPHGRNNAPSKRAPLLPPSKRPPHNASCSKRAEAVPSQSKHAPSGTRTRQSRSEIAPLAAKQRNLAPRLRQTVRRGVFPPTGQCTLWADGMPHPKRNGTTRADGVFPLVNGARSPVLTPQPCLAAMKRAERAPQPPKQHQHESQR